MKLRVAIKVSNRIATGGEYRKSTERRSSRRLSKANMPTGNDLWWCGLLAGFQESCPRELAALQFRAAMSLHETLNHPTA